MKNFVYVDNSNVYIEGCRLLAVRKQLAVTSVTTARLTERTTKASLVPFVEFCRKLVLCHSHSLLKQSGDGVLVLTFSLYYTEAGNPNTT